MASKQQMSGMLGVYLTAVELIRLGFIVSPTSRSAMGADLLVTDQGCKRAWSVQIKTNGTARGFWLAGRHARTLRSRSHIYVLVNVAKLPKPPTFYVVPSSALAKRSQKSGWGTKGAYSIYRKKLGRYTNNWKVFGNPLGEVPVA